MTPASSLFSEELSYLEALMIQECLELPKVNSICGLRTWEALFCPGAKPLAPPAHMSQTWIYSDPSTASWKATWQSLLPGIEHNRVFICITPEICFGGGDPNPQKQKQTLFISYLSKIEQHSFKNDHFVRGKNKKTTERSKYSQGIVE